MALLGYKKRFVKPIKDGTKEQTIRGFRKVPIKNGERIYMYTGLRTKHCKKIGEAICFWQSKITIDENYVVVHTWSPFDKPKPRFETRVFYLPKDINDFAQKDGFTDWEDMKQFWYAEHGEDCFPFTGVIYYFRKVRALPRKPIKAAQTYT